MAKDKRFNNPFKIGDRVVLRELGEVRSFIRSNPDMRGTIANNVNYKNIKEYMYLHNLEYITVKRIDGNFLNFYPERSKWKFNEIGGVYCFRLKLYKEQFDGFELEEELFLV